MTKSQEHRGIAALAICESMLISLTERKLISEKEASNILRDAVAALEGEKRAADKTATYDDAVADIEKILHGTNGVRRGSPDAR